MTCSAVWISGILSVLGVSVPGPDGRGDRLYRGIDFTVQIMRPYQKKWHGLKDVECYRQRYVGLIVNPEVKNNFILRSKAIKSIRDFLDGEGFGGGDTNLHTIAGVRLPGITHHNTWIWTCT